MAARIKDIHSGRGPRRGRDATPVLAALFLASAGALHGVPAGAHLGSIEVVTRPDGRALPVHAKNGRRWIVGTPGREYAIRVCNTTDGRVLAVMSVDGVNVVSGDTASPEQSGYVLGARECADIAGWRKNLSSIAAFYFTELPDAYAARTGRPENVGVIGVAFFRERTPPVAWGSPPAKIAAGRTATPSARQEAASDTAAAEDRASEAAATRNEAGPLAPSPAPMAKIGTGHGRRESSQAQTTRFERDSAVPGETVAIHYDRRENLIAMGILPPPAIARAPNPFPAWTPGFVPDPPQR